MNYLKSMEDVITSKVVPTNDKEIPANPSNFLPIDPNNLDPRFFTPEYARLFGGYGALSQIRPPNYNGRTDVYGRTVGSTPDAPISASSTLFNYLTVTPGFTKVSSLNYQVYRDAKIQMYTPVRYCDKSDALRDGKVVLDSRGLIASMVPVSEKELPNAKQFADFQVIDDDDKRVNLTPDEDDEVGDVTNVDLVGVYNPNFLFFVKVSDVTLEKMTAAKNAMTGRNGLVRQKTEDDKLSRVRQETNKKNIAISAQQTQKQEAIDKVLKIDKNGVLYEITDLLRDDRSVNFLNDSLARYDIYESPLFGENSKTFVGRFVGIDVTCEGVINSFKLTLNVFKPVVSAVAGLLIGATGLTIGSDARVVDTTNSRYWVNALEENEGDSNDPNYLKNFSVLEQKSVNELSNLSSQPALRPLATTLHNYQQTLKKYTSFVAEYTKKQNPFFQKIQNDDSGRVYTTLAGFDCYGYESSVTKTTPIYMGKLQSVKGGNVAFTKWYKPKKTGDAINSCDSKYSLANYDIYIYRMPEDAVTNGIVKRGLSGDDLLQVFITMALGKGNEAGAQRDDLQNDYNKVVQFFRDNEYSINVIKKINNAKIFYYSYPDNPVSANKIMNNDTIFWEPFMRIDVGDIKTVADFFNNVVLLRNEFKSAFTRKPQTIPSVIPANNAAGLNEEHKDDGSPAVVRTIPEVFKVGDLVQFKNGETRSCGGYNARYSIIGGTTLTGQNNKVYGQGATLYHLFAITPNKPFYATSAQLAEALIRPKLDVVQSTIPGTSCTVHGDYIQKIKMPDLPAELIGDPTKKGGGAKHTRRSHSGPRKNVTRHGNNGLMRRRTSHKGRKRGAHKTAKK